MSTPKRIYLIGFMASGKSTIAAHLAKQLNWTAHDLDAMIVEKAGKSIPQIFADEGEEFFRRLERDCLHDTQEWSNSVIATGGGTPCFWNNMVWINNNGSSVYLQTTVNTLSKRLWKAKYSRPLVSKFTNKIDLHTFVSQKLTARNIFYTKAQHIIDANNKNVAVICNTIATILQIQHLCKK